MEIINLIVNTLSSFGTIVAFVALGYQISKEKREKKEEQANKISTWIDNGYILSDTENKQAIVIYNQSNYPIYDVVFSIDDLYGEKGFIGTGEEECSCIDVLPPGKYVVEKEFEGFGMNHRFSSSITFRDYLGKYWTRDVRGILIQEKGKDVIQNKRAVCRPYIEVFYRKIEE